MKFTVLVCFFLFLLSPGYISAFETHRYEVEAARLTIYPVNVALTLKQKHALLFEIASDLQLRSQEEFANFIAVCLQELALMYEEEATRHSADQDSREISAGKNPWRRELLSLADELFRLSATIDPGMDLSVDMDDTGELLIRIDDRVHILSNPVLNKPYALDDRIISRVCQVYICNPELLQRKEIQTKRTIIIEASWFIAENDKPEYVTKDGLHFVFGNLDNRSEKQIGSLKLTREIKLFTETLQDAIDKGVTVDWKIFAVKNFKGSYDYRILLNEFSDSIYIHLPELHHVKDWQQDFMPWVKAQLNHENINHYINGDQVLAYVLNK